LAALIYFVLLGKESPNVLLWKVTSNRVSISYALMNELMGLESIAFEV